MSVGEGTLIYRSDKREILTTSFKAFGQELPDTSLKVFFGSLYNEFNLPILVKSEIQPYCLARYIADVNATAAKIV